ncbi:hypothetical protein EDC94DRAFT_625126 [Helicostylum pulchrum]|nr:hypothetical protein EDC94DRAFT_625126 [Helicostylum pulchrum]
MATTIQHKPVLLQQNQQTEDDDVALATYLSGSLRFDHHHQPQQQQQQQQQGQYNKNVAYYHQQQLQQQQQKKQRPRTRVTSNTSSTSSQIQLQKSTSTPIINNARPRKPQQQQKQKQQPIPSSSVSSTLSNKSPCIENVRRRSVITLNSERRPSVTSTTSAMSMQSDMSMNTKLSLSKKLRKVFSMNNLKSNNLDSLSERNGSNSSISSSISAVTEPSPLSKEEQQPRMSFRRRSIASLSSLFQKGASTNEIQVKPTPPAPTPTQSTTPKKSPQEARRHSSGDLRQIVMEDNKKKEKRPELRVDVRKGGLKARSTNNSNSNNNITPDSPNSVISSRSSFTRLPPPQQQQQQQQRSFVHLPESGLPSPTPSTSSSSKVVVRNNSDEDYLSSNSKKALGLHFGLGLHGSPKLRPASSSTSSLVMETRRIQFCSTIQVHETFAPADYDRRCDTNATCQKLTPIMAMKIKQELNEYKLTDMEVHVESRQYTHFFL